LEGIGAISGLERESAQNNFQDNVTTPTDPNTDDDAVTREDGDDPDPFPDSSGDPSQSIKLAIGKVCTNFLTIYMQAVQSWFWF
jgi:hypothetical protein